MDEWLKAHKPIDLRLKSEFAPHRYGIEYAEYEDGGRDFFRLLRMIEHLPMYDLGWSGGGLRLWEQEAEYLADSKRMSEAAGYEDEDGSISIVDDAESLSGHERVYYTLSYEWGVFGTRLNADFKRFRPEYDFTADHLIALVEAVTRWKRPQHLEFGPFEYFNLHHPLDRARQGIG